MIRPEALHIPESLNIPVLKDVSIVAKEQNVKAYVIGGFVRDYFLNRDSKDIDIVVEGSGIELAQHLAKRLKVKVNVFKSFGTAMLRYGDVELEFVGARKESYRANSRKPIVEDGTLEEDQNRRDFTINAMAFSLNSSDFGVLVDPFNGIGDIQKKCLRTPLDPDITYNDDPLRMMRAIRFACQLGFDIVDESKKAIFRNKDRMAQGVVSMERISDELQKIMASPRPSMGIDLMNETGILPYILPWINRLKGVEIINGQGHKDNYIHTLKVLDNVVNKTDNVWLRWAALLHDVAKPTTKRFETGQGWTFHGHEHLGANMVPNIFKQLKLPLNDKMKYVQKLVGLHLRPIILAEEEVTDSAIRRLLFDAGDDVDDLMLLCQADITSGNEKKVKKYLDNFALVKVKLTEIESKDKIRNFQPPITGDFIMHYYNLPPCSQVGKIKTAIKDAILDGLIQNEQVEAFEYMKKIASAMGLTPKD